MHPLPIFLDIAASSLGSRSDPIEVAWNTPDGTIEAHLISPAAIARWTDWSVQAEQLHTEFDDSLPLLWPDGR